MPLPAECGEGPEYVKMDKPKKPGKTMATARPVQRAAARKTATRLHTSASRTNRTTVRKKLLASKVNNRANRLQTSQTTEMAETANSRMLTSSRMQISRMPKSSRMQISNRTQTSSSQEITVSRIPKVSRRVKTDKAESATIETTATDRTIARTASSAITTSAAMHQKTYVLAATEEEEVLHRRRLTRNQILANQLQLSTLRRKKMS